MKKHRLLVRGIVVAAAVSTIFTVSSSADTATQGAATGLNSDSLMHCQSSHVLTISPGVTPNPQAVSFSTGGVAVPIDCVGQINGHIVTGPGTYEESGVGTASCAEGSGHGSYTISVPTTGGTQQVNGFFIFGFSGPAGYELGLSITAVFRQEPVQGDCFNTPMTQARLHQQALIRT